MHQNIQDISKLLSHANLCLDNGNDVSSFNFENNYNLSNKDLITWLNNWGKGYSRESAICVHPFKVKQEILECGLVDLLGTIWNKVPKISKETCEAEYESLRYSWGFITCNEY